MRQEGAWPGRTRARGKAALASRSRPTVAPRTALLDSLHHDSESTMKDRPEGETASGDGRLQRTGRWLRRHKWKAAALVPVALFAAVALYVAILFPLTPSIGDIRKAK